MRRTYRSALVVLIAVVCGWGTDNDGAHVESYEIDSRVEDFWLDIGTEDPFVPGARALARAMGEKVRSYPGGHMSQYWDAHWDEYLRFYANACQA